MINEKNTDEQIIKQVIQGNVESFKIIVKRYQNKVFSIGMRFFNNTEDAEDFAQDIFIKIYENLKSYRGRAPFRFWLTKIAYNYGINKKKSSRTEPAIDFDQNPGSDQTPDRQHERGEIHQSLMSSINRLPEKYRICLDFYFFLNLTYNQINDITGIPVNTIKSNVLRAKNIIRDELKGTIAEDYHEL